MSHQSEHPTYPNPFIVEAVCEIKFERTSDTPWDNKITGQIFKEIQADFPNLVPLSPQAGIEIVSGQGRVGYRSIQNTMVARFADESERRLIQIGSMAVSANIVNRYDGWKNLEDHIAYTWENTRSRINPQTISRIGLRYINAIPKSSSNESIRDFIQANDYVPKATALSKSFVTYRSEFGIEENTRIVIILVDREPDDQFENGALMFDIDCIKFTDNIEIDSKQVLSTANQQHELIWRVFSESMTEKSISMLEGKVCV